MCVYIYTYNICNLLTRFDRSSFFQIGRMVATLIGHCHIHIYIYVFFQQFLRSRRIQNSRKVPSSQERWLYIYIRHRPLGMLGRVGGHVWDICCRGFFCLPPKQFSPSGLRSPICHFCYSFVQNTFYFTTMCTNTSQDDNLKPA